MSQPHVHRKDGPLFKLGQHIIESCHLEPPSYDLLQTRIERKRRINANTSEGNGRTPSKRVKTGGCIENINHEQHSSKEPDHDDYIQKSTSESHCIPEHYASVEPYIDSVNQARTDEQSCNQQPASAARDNAELVDRPITNPDVYQKLRQQVQDDEYRRKKRMSAAVFKYFVNATPAQQLEMQVQIDEQLQAYWRTRTDLIKFDDMGDALLHCLNLALCQASRYRQLAPSSSTLHKNRTVVIVVLPDKGYWVTIDCCWNQFVIQDMGFYDTQLTHLKYNGARTVDVIVEMLHPRLLKAITEFDSTLDCLSQTGYIKVIVKQLKSYGLNNTTAKASGSLTNSTVQAMMNICDTVLAEGTLNVTSDKKSQWQYSRTCKQTGKKIEVVRSSGKHLNAVLSCLQWMKANLPDFVRDRPMRINAEGRLKFYRSLESVTDTDTADDHNEQRPRLGLIHLSQNVLQLMKDTRQISNNCSKMILADLVLVGLNCNQQCVGAVSHNYRKNTQKPITNKSSLPATSNPTRGSAPPDHDEMMPDVEP